MTKNDRMAVYPQDSKGADIAPAEDIREKYKKSKYKDLIKSGNAETGFYCIPKDQIKRIAQVDKPDLSQLPVECLRYLS